jgi:DNA-binding NarL/FixJ family response regulator
LEGTVSLNRSIRILLVDDFSPFRDFLRSSFRHIPGFEIVGEATDGVEAIQKTQELNPDLILMDIGLPKLNGLEAARQIQNVSAHLKILFVTGICDWDTIERAFLCGAGGYLVKADAAGELRPGIELVLMGSQFLSTTAIRHILDECKHGGPTPYLNRISCALAKRTENESV